MHNFPIYHIYQMRFLNKKINHIVHTTYSYLNLKTQKLLFLYKIKLNKKK